MVKLWVSPEDYPERLVGRFDEELVDRFHFSKGEPAPSGLATPVVRFNAPVGELREWEALLSDSRLPIVGRRALALLTEHAGSDIEVLDIRIEANGTLMDDYKLVNVTRTISGLDHDRSRWSLIRGTTTRSYRTLFFNDGCMGTANIAREKESLSYVVVSDRLAGVLESAKISGIRLATDQEYFGPKPPTSPT